MNAFVSVRDGLLILFVAAALSSCRSAPTAPTTPAMTVTSVTILPSNQSVTLSRIGETHQLTATALVSNSGAQTVTATAMWQSSNTAVVTVSGGLVTAVGAGTATISATYAGIAGTAIVTVAVGNIMTANIDGAAFHAVDIYVGKTNGFQIIMSGTDPKFTLSIAVFVPLGVGTFDLQAQSESEWASLSETTAQGVSWASDVKGGGGTLTVSTLTSTSASGTFSLTLAPDEGMPPNTRVVTNGVFNVVFGM